MCIFCCGVTLVAFLCPVYTVEYIYVFLTYMYFKVFKQKIK